MQAGGDLDYTEWTGNQRVLHYGPLAVRDKFFYYYPKGWDILYPASFGFFPYRTKLVFVFFEYKVVCCVFYVLPVSVGVVKNKKVVS